MFNELPIDKMIQAAMRGGADYADVFVERTRQTTIVADDRRLDRASTFFDVGVGIRVLRGEHTAYGSTNDLTRKNLLGLARGVGRAAHAKRKRAPAVVFHEGHARAVATVGQHPFGVAIENKRDVVMRANDIAWQAGKEVKQVRIHYQDTVRRIWVASSDASLATDEQVGTLLAAHVVASDGKILQTGYEPAGGAVGFELFDETPPEEIALRAATRAIRMLAARPAPAGQMPVILSAEAGGTMIHEAVGHGLEADLACDGLSVYSGKLWQKVASDLVTVVDDATLKGRRGSITFDDEGTPAQRTVLIDHGVLKNYLADRRSSVRFEIPATGNGRRQSYAFPPIARMTNTIILPGADDPKKILSSTASGLFVKRMGGGQVNTINGDFVFDVQEGYLIENGKLGDAVRGATLVGNGPKVLESIDMVGRDLGFSIGTCGKEGQEAPVSCGQPTIRIPEMVVGGTAKK